MKSTLDFYIKKNRANPAERKRFALDLRRSNIFRCTIISVTALLISGAILIINIPRVGLDSSVDRWRGEAILLNKVVCTIFSMLLITSIVLYRSKKNNNYLSAAIIVITFSAIPLWGTIGAILDQRTTNSIISFMVVCLGLGAGMLIRPWLSAIILGVNYVIFYFGITYTQADPYVLEFNRMAGFWCIVISEGLSVFFWKNNMARFTQNRIIIQQKNELESNYRRLLSSAEDLKKAVAAKNKFFSILGHDLRGPLTSTLSLLQIVNDAEYEEDSAEQQKSLKVVENGLQEILKLLEELLLWSQTQTNAIKVTAESIKVADMVNPNLKLTEVFASKKGVRIECNVNGSQCYADKNMVSTIVRNMLNNAIKFSHPHSTVKIFAQTRVDAISGKKMSDISVADEGVGMKEEMVNNLFKIEHKSTTPGTQKERGTGLGLILCKELAELNHGKISVISSYGQGTTITLSLPVGPE